MDGNSESPETCPCFGKTTSKFGTIIVLVQVWCAPGSLELTAVNHQHLELRNLHWQMLLLLCDGNI